MGCLVMLRRRANMMGRSSNRSSGILPCVPIGRGVAGAPPPTSPRVPPPGPVVPRSPPRLWSSGPTSSAGGCGRGPNPDMSGPTWPPPKTPGSPERPVPQISDSGSAVNRQLPKKVSSDTRPKYVVRGQNRGGGGGGMASRYMASGHTAGPMQQHHQEDPRFHPKSNDLYYHQPPPHGLKEDQSLNPHMDRFQLMHRGPPEKPVGHHSITDAEIASLTCMLDDLDSYSQNSTQLYDNVPYNKRITRDRYKPSAQTGAPSQSRLFMGLPQPQYRPTPPFPRHPLYFPQPDYADAQVSKPYPKPVPSSTPTGPRFSVQDKTAQPVTYSQMGRQAEQGYSPPPHHQHALRPSPQNQTVPHGWYPSNPASQAQELHSARGYKGSAAGSGGRVTQCPTSNRGPETKKSVSCSAPSFACQPSKGSAALRSEEELDQKLVYDINHPPTEEYFGRCARCGDNILADGSGCIAMEQVFHVECLTCVKCHTRLGWQLFYALDKQSYCKSCYISTLERCSMCSKLIRDHILRFMGKAYHPSCFNCVVCGCCLEGMPFTVDATYQIYCLDDFHRKFASCCSVCGQAIMPEPGQDAAVRIVALDRSFHVNCYVCEECGLLLSSEIKGRGCYPFDGHILCKGCSARRIQDLSDNISTD